MRNFKNICFTTRCHLPPLRSLLHKTGMLRKSENRFQRLTPLKLPMAPFLWTSWTKLQMKIHKVRSTSTSPFTMVASDILSPQWTARCRYVCLDTDSNLFLDTEKLMVDAWFYIFWRAMRRRMYHSFHRAFKSRVFDIREEDFMARR